MPLSLHYNDLHIFIFGKSVTIPLYFIPFGVACTMSVAFYNITRREFELWGARIIDHIFIQSVLEIILANMAIRELITNLNLSKNSERIFAEGVSCCFILCGVITCDISVQLSTCICDVINTFCLTVGTGHWAIEVYECSWWVWLKLVGFGRRFWSCNHYISYSLIICRMVSIT